MGKNSHKEASELLNPSQRNSLQIALRLLEEKLYVAQLLMQGGSYQGVLFSLRVDLDDQQRKKYQSLFQEIISVILKIKEQFNLSNSTTNLSRQIRGTVHSFHSVLLDETATKLKRYGAVANGLEKTLDPLILELIQHLVNLNQLLNTEKKSRKE